jgi:phosphatidylethanolamine N-methyltransferase
MDTIEVMNSLLFPYMCRAGDVKLVLLVFYVSAAALIPELSSSQYIILHFIHASFWRIFHSFGLGLLLKAQSDNKYMVRHFMKHYYYLKSDIRRGPLAEAFNNWKSLYNMSLCLTYGT